MFSDTQSRDRLKKKTFSQESQALAGATVSLKSTREMKQLLEVQGSRRTSFYRETLGKQASFYSTVLLDLGETEKKVSFEEDTERKEKAKKEKPSMVITLPIKSEELTTKGTQTDYRESETQTLPWNHEIKAQGKLLAELFSLDWFISDKNYPPGTEEVMLIEKARQKLAWENVIKKLRGKENEIKRESMVRRMAINEAAFRESRKDEEEKRRTDISRRQMKETMETFEEKLCMKLQKSYGYRRKENDSKIDYWNHQLARGIRKIKSSRGPLRTKPGIVEMHKDRGSDLWAPKLRHGENPFLRHEIIDIQCRYLKRFHGLEILEKYVGDVLYPNFSNSGNDSKISKPRIPGLCLRKFSEKVTEEPKEEKVKYVSLKISVPPPSPETSIPRTSRLRSDSEENLYQASLLLAKLIKGRSIQAQKFLKYFELVSQ